MPPRPFKHINGQEFTQTQFRRKICDTLNDFPEARGKALDIATAWNDPDWLEPVRKHDLSVTMNNMAREGVLKRIEGERGVFETSALASQHRGGVSRFEQLENSILTVIRNEGGMARFKDILEAHRPEHVGAMEFYRSGIKTSITGMLAKSTRIRQDSHERGLYHLPIEELHTMPLTGMTALWLIRRVGGDAHKSNLKRDEQSHSNRTGWYAWRDHFFCSVGGAFRLLREIRETTVQEMFDDRHYRVRGAVATIRNRAPSLVKRINDELRADHHAEMVAKGETNELEIERTFEPASEEELAFFIYDHFERGTTDAHVYAPLDLYINVADYYGVDPVDLSRGLIFPDVDSSLKDRPDFSPIIKTVGYTNKNSWWRKNTYAARMEAEEKRRAALHNK